MRKEGKIEHGRPKGRKESFDDWLRVIQGWFEMLLSESKLDHLLERRE
jgi:hypothetical protein